VLLRVDGTEAMRAMADSQGNFVAMFTLPPADQPRLLSLAEAGPPERVAEQTVALAPVAGPKPVEATAQTETPQPEAPQPEPPQALLLSDQGVQVLQAPAAGVAGQLSVDAISYTPDGAVQLSGQAAAGAGLRLYLDNAPLAEVLAAATGQWFTTLRDVPPGLYTLRADQIGADGKVTARLETPFLRETPEALAAALKPQAIPGQPRQLVPPAALSGQPAAPTTAPPAAPVVVSPETAQADSPLSITVQPGFTLWRIAHENFGDGVMYVKVFEANKSQIRDPDLIYPGQVFTIPKG
ncbi:MAG TPA: LysM peptidoglycan-binding domain-containing protein, partial [Gemmobacter sp.]|nr:LysM peptidoglycan-binding domain-containing protein [Gemmobacter sp.]